MVKVKREEARGKLVRAFTLCDADCEPREGIHNPHFLTCDRCGAHIHVRCFEVVTAAGEEMVVGSECMKDVLGFKVGAWHVKALEVAKRLQKWFPCEWYFGDKTIRVQPAKCILVENVISPRHGLGSYYQTIPHRMSESLIRAGIDLGLWVRAHWDDRVLLLAEGIEQADILLEELRGVAGR